MKYLKKYNESGEYSELMDIMTSLVNKGLLPDKDFLHECFSDLLDDRRAEPLHSNNANDFLGKYSINEREPVTGSFIWSIKVKLPKSGIGSIVYSDKENNLDDLKSHYQYQVGIIDEISYAIERVKTKYPSYHILVYDVDRPKKTKDGYMIVEVSVRDRQQSKGLQEFFVDVSKEIGVSHDEYNYREYSYNPITWLYKKYDYTT